MKKSLILILSLSIKLGFSQTTLLTNLQGCYPLDCDNAVNNVPANTPALNGTPFGVTCAVGHLGAPNTAYQFAGAASSRIELPASPLLKPNAISVSGWYNSDNLAAAYLVFTYNGCGTNQEAYSLSVSSGGFTVTKASGSGICTRTQLTSTAPIAANTWYHVAFYIDNSIMQLYVNNVLYATTHTIPWGYVAGKRVILGGSQEIFEAAFKGRMDNIRFYDRQLTATEVNNLYVNDPLCSATGGSTVTPPSGCCLGNNCGAAQNALTTSYQIPMNNFNFNFTTPAGTKSQVHIGKPACAASAVRLDVADDNNGTAIKGFVNTTTQSNIGVNGIAANPSSGLTSIGVLGEVGIRGNYRVAGVAGFSGGPANLGALPLGQDVAIYGNSRSNTGTWAGYFDGDVNINGQAFCTSSSWSSDRRFKTNIQELGNVSEKIGKLKSYTYDFKLDEFKQYNFPKTEQLGFIAQELKEVFPQLVTEDKNGYLAVNYVGLIPVLFQGFKEQQKEIENLKQMMEMLSAKTLNGNGLTDKQLAMAGFQLGQNEPNPFTTESTIKYTLPQTVTTAVITVYDLSGKQVASFPIQDKGEASIKITSEKLTAGMYIYSIIADGKVIDTKRMIVTSK
jgi:hypothetical protein